MRSLQLVRLRGQSAGTHQGRYQTESHDTLKQSMYSLFPLLTAVQVTVSKYEVLSIVVIVEHYCNARM